MVAEAEFTRFCICVNDVEVDVVVCDILLDCRRKLLIELFRLPCAVEKEGSAVLDLMDHVIAVDVGLRMAGQEIRSRDQIRGTDRIFRETQMALGNTVGFLGVIFEVCLCVFAGIVTDDLCGVLVCADGSVRAKTPELAGNSVCGFGNERFMNFQGQMCDIVVDTDCEELLRCFGVHVVEDCLQLSRGDVLGRKTVSAAEDLRRIRIICEGCAGIEIYRTGNGARFLGAVHRCDLFNRGRDGLLEGFHVERTEQMDLEKSGLFAAGVEIINDFLCCFTGAAHHDDGAVCVFGTVVVEDVVVTACDFVDALHVFFNHCRDVVVCAVVGFFRLIVDIGALNGGAHQRVFRVHCDFMEVTQRILVHEFRNLVEIDNFDLLDFVGCTETVKEMHERNAGLDRCQMRNRAEVHRLLYGCGAHHSGTGRTAGHDILMVTEDVVCVLGNRTRRNVEDGRHPVSGHDVEVRNHEEKTLR